MWWRAVLFLVRTAKWSAAIAAALFFLLILLATAGHLRIFADSVTLPNGMILKREFDFSRYGRHDMFAADGRTRLVRNIEMVCFDDRYVEVLAYQAGDGGLFDAQSADGRPLSGDSRDAAERRLAGGHGCNGYYTGMLGPGLLYDGFSEPFLPPCAWRNFSNPALKHKEWLLRPCEPRDFGSVPAVARQSNFP